MRDFGLKLLNEPATNRDPIRAGEQSSASGCGRPSIRLQSGHDIIHSQRAVVSEDKGRRTDFPPAKRVDPTGCAIVDQDVPGPAMRREELRAHSL